MTKIRIAYIPHKKVARHQKRGLKWGADIMLEGLQKTVNSNYMLIPHYSLEDIPNADVIHFHNVNGTIPPPPQIFGRLTPRKYRPRNRTSIIAELVNIYKGIPIVGGIRGMGHIGETEMLSHFNALHVGNARIKKELIHPNVFVCHAGVDTELFSPSKEKPESFSICWAGDSEKDVKNFNVLQQLGFNLETATRKGYRPHNEMPEFYRSSCVYVNLSSSEGFCRPIVEAAACGLAVVSTNTGVAPELLDPHWIVDENPNEPRGLKVFQSRIQELKEDPEMMWQEGLQNRERSKQFAWSNITHQFEEMWYNLYKLGAD